jgi:hypothetical protein
MTNKSGHSHKKHYTKHKNQGQKPKPRSANSDGSNNTDKTSSTNPSVSSQKSLRSSNYKSSSNRPYRGNSKYMNKNKNPRRKTYETASDIRDDIKRIEKEIELEIKTISNMML